MGNLEDYSPPCTEFSIINIPLPNLNKYNEPALQHNTWASSLPNNTILLYMDSWKTENGHTGCGATTYWIENGTLRWLQNHHYNLAPWSEVYDAELHAVQEGLLLLHPYEPPNTIYICMDNQAAIQTLSNNQHSHQFARNALTTAWE
jgi:hypothetical protein